MENIRKSSHKTKQRDFSTVTNYMYMKKYYINTHFAEEQEVGNEAPELILLSNEDRIQVKMMRIDNLYEIKCMKNY